MIESLPIVGVDIDSRSCVCFFEGKRRRRKFDNNPSGFKELREWLKSQADGPFLVCMESTGRYSEPVAEYLDQHGHMVVVANPGFVSQHKESLNQHNKTDPTDAEAIGSYARCFRDKLRLWKPLDEVHKRLRDVLGQMYLLKKTITAFSNRGQCGLFDDDVISSNDQILSHLRSELATLAQLREELFEQLPKLDEVRKIVDEVPGIGPEIADSLAVHVRFEDFRNGRDLAMFLGCGSSQWASGKQKRRGKQKKTGDPQMRSLLRQGAVSAMRSSFYRPFVERLRKKGLSNGKIVGAIARKMVLIAYALWRRKEPFDRFYEHPLAKKRT